VVIRRRAAKPFRCRRGSRSSLIPVPPRRCPPGPRAEMLDRPLDVTGRHGARIGHLAVVALADHGQSPRRRDPSGGEHRRLKDGAHGDVTQR